ncbi:MAG: hypothetical protein IT281_03745 [Ignavibacteria bacterium]|nr:hypothetical protein [Ignavibacteria bacterium]
MTKAIIIIIFIILSILVGGCSDTGAISKNESKGDSLILQNDVKKDLSSIEEITYGLDYNSALENYSKVMPENASVTRFRYFVIISDLGEELTYSLIDNDIRNTISSMESNFVSKTPVDVTPIFLFSDFEKYKTFVLSNFNIEESDISPYGFFKISKNTIAIRYVNWKGSISHEVTHKFTKRDFPDMPSWFDEGFASLNEKSTFRNGVLIGDFSFRIIPLRRALKENTYTGLETLMQTDDNELYGKRSSFYYAQSRYLLMYLQQKGLLVDFYKHFRDTYTGDKTGISQLEKVTGKPISQIDEEVLKFVKSFDDVR